MIDRRGTLEERFWSKVKKTNTCWFWTGGTNNMGYGMIGESVKPYRHTLAHRLSFELANGNIPQGMFVLHACDTPACVRPDHLSLGTQTDNMQDATQKGRVRKGASHPSHLRPETVAHGDRHGAHTHPESVPKGSARPNAKLTEDQVCEIRTAREAGELLASIAERFRLNKVTVWAVVHRRTWRHVT